jgi:hypothetical protein
MLAYLADRPTDLAWYRLGADSISIRQHLSGQTRNPKSEIRNPKQIQNPRSKIRNPEVQERADRGSGLVVRILNRFRISFFGFRVFLIRERLIRRLLGREYDLLQRARFRHGGEVHHWMYDRQALRELLTAAGFDGFRLVAAGESDIPGWADDPLDTQSDGRPVKPDSLYVEAIRP